MDAGTREEGYDMGQHARNLAPLTPTEARTRPLPLRRLERRYDPDAVDDLLDEVAAALSDFAAGRPPSLTAEQLAAVSLRPPRLLRPGYDASAVDDLLERAVRTLAAARRPDGRPPRH